MSGSAPSEPISAPSEPSPAPVEASLAPVDASPSAGSLAPRLCHLRIWSDYQGYGFNLHAQKGKIGQFIGKVDDGSPAEAAGVKNGDKIIEVNDINVLSSDHRAVVQHIKQNPNETRLLVLDDEAFNYYKERDEMETINSHMHSVQTIVCPYSKPIGKLRLPALPLLHPLSHAAVCVGFPYNWAHFLTQFAFE